MQSTRQPTNQPSVARVTAAACLGRSSKRTYLYNATNGIKRGEEGFELLEFIGCVVDQLCISLPVTPANDLKHPKRYDNGLPHEPHCFTKNSNTDGSRMNCRRICKRKGYENLTSGYCNTCEVHLCFKGCFVDWHTPGKEGK